MYSGEKAIRLFNICMNRYNNTGKEIYINRAIKIFDLTIKNLKKNNKKPQRKPRGPNALSCH